MGIRFLYVKYIEWTDERRLGLIHMPVTRKYRITCHVKDREPIRNVYVTNIFLIQVTVMDKQSAPS